GRVPDDQRYRRRSGRRARRGLPSGGAARRRLRRFPGRSPRDRARLPLGTGPGASVFWRSFPSKNAVPGVEFMCPAPINLATSAFSTRFPMNPMDQKNPNSPGRTADQPDGGLDQPRASDAAGNGNGDDLNLVDLTAQLEKALA